uniref:MFS domain-containing protein n=1 Tax=Macrostomum lignano TaxID=282301 RepID=A0A1I8G4Y0_9PLAT
ERDAWAYENAVLQARLADLAQRAERQAGVEAAYSEELETLRAENRDLRIQMQEERLARELEAGDDAAAKSGTAAAAGDQATQQQVDQLVNELAALKRDLERLQHRYRTERDRWSARRRELEKAIDDLIAGKDPKAVQKRLKAAEAAEPKAEELHRSGFDPVADDDDLATATMAYYSSANTVKKEKAVLELELEDEKRKNRVEVLRDQVMRANKKARGEAADDGEAEGAAGSRDADLPLEKGSVEASEKRRDSRRPSETPKQAAVQQKLNEAHEELKAAAEERDQARAEGERLKAENERRREENKRMKDELVRAAEQEEKANEERKRDAEEKARLEDENRELKDKLDKQRRENDAEVDKLKQEKRRLEDKLRNIRDKISSLCLITYLVPCYTFGMNAEAVGENCFVCGLGMVCGLSFILGPMIRSKIRERQGIPGSFMADCCIWFFCGFCALVQEGLEVKTFAARPQRIERE